MKPNLVVEFSLKPRVRGGSARSETSPIGKLPRVTRLMALAIKFDGLLRDGVVRDYADLARLGHVTRARMTQIMNMLNLAPDIQEQILFLPPVTAGRDPIAERNLRRLTAIPRWDKQRNAWRQMLAADL